MNVVILTCGDLGPHVAEVLVPRPEIDDVTVVTTPYRTPDRTLVEKVRHVYRMRGVKGFAEVLAGKLGRVLDHGHKSESPPGDRDLSGVRQLHFEDFHDGECVGALRDLRADLGIFAGTYILKPSVFEIPREGSINLHTGKVPEYRGAAPVFWELYNGEEEVGITVHRVTQKLDAGAVLAQEVFPLDPAPAGDVMDYIERYREEVLRPNGVRMLAEVVTSLARGDAREWKQDVSRARTYRSPTHRDIKELRRRVRQRRGGKA